MVNPQIRIRGKSIERKILYWIRFGTQRKYAILVFWKPFAIGFVLDHFTSEKQSASDLK